MKRLLGLICAASAVITCTAVESRAQDVIPNGGFETWVAEEPTDWFTSNLGLPGSGSVTQTSDKHSGSSAVEVKVVDYFGIGFGGFVQSETPCPLTRRWTELRGFYQLNSVGGDILAVQVTIYRNGNIIGGGGFVDSVSTTGGYHGFVGPIAIVPDSIPDSAFIQAGLYPGSSEFAHVGSWFKLDDLTFAGDSTSSCPIALSGDTDASGEVKSSDAIYLVNYVLKAGPEPLPCPAAGDADGSGDVKSSDIIYLVNYVLKGGAAPIDICALIPDVWSCP
jgi:hypothetical protein